MDDQLTKTVIDVVASYTEVDASEITLDTSFEELAIDSLDGVSLINDLEAAFLIQIPNEDALRIKTVRQAEECLQRYMSGNVADTE